MRNDSTLNTEAGDLDVLLKGIQSASTASAEFGKAIADLASRLPEKLHPALVKAIDEQQRKIWRAQGIVQCVTKALYHHFEDWPAAVPQWNLALETVDEMLQEAARALWDDELLPRAREIDAVTKAEDETTEVAEKR